MRLNSAQVRRSEESEESLQALRRAYEAFLSAYPSYTSTSAIDSLRTREYARLDRLGHVYVDYTGGGLYAQGQLEAHMRLLRESVYGNPHSTNPTSLAMTELVERTRAHVLDFFRAPPSEYTVIFTANASAALKLVGESYPFTAESIYLLTFDNHNSVNGIREFARARGADSGYVPLVLPEMRLDEPALAEALDKPGAGPSLFAYPAQSNFSGVQHDLAWIDRAHAEGWDVILDAAAFAPTNRLDLSLVRPDFVPLSFYKMFGYPTGVGCLIARREALDKLRRPWFAGGTITVASVQGDRFYYAEGEAAFEDGTLNYLMLPAVDLGLRHLESIGMEVIHERVRCLTAWLLDSLSTLRHSGGAPLVRVYGPLDTRARGGAVAMNFYDPQGRYIDHRWIEARANQDLISLRTGCFCNPGGGETALGLGKAELVACFNQPEERLTMDDFRLCIDGKSTGAVRVSLGLVSNFDDVYRFVEFARGLLDLPSPETSPE